MKVTQIFGLVLLFHLVAISLILLQPGCQTRQPPPPPERPGSTPAPSASTASNPVRSDYVAPSSRQEPTRPTSDRITTSPSGQSNLDPAFNAGLTGGGPLQPVLQPAVSLGSSGNDDFEDQSGQTYYTVVAGDSLSRIAREFGVSVNAIKTANNLTSNTIRVGQDLTIPTPSAPTQNSPVDAAGSQVYQVRSGDTLSGIASRHGVTVTDLKSNNGLSSDTIRVGQELYIPGSRSSSPAPSGGNAPQRSAPAPDSGNTYTVQPGDTPGGIARRYGIDHRELMRVNNIASASRMQVGQRLIIPAGGTRPAGNATSTAQTSGTTTTPSPAPRQAPASPPASLTPQTSQPARIGTTPAPEPDPFDELNLLENGEIPLMDVEVIDQPRR